MGHDKTTNKKSDHSNQGGQLKVAKACNGMTRGASSRITCAKTYKKTSNDQDGHSLYAQYVIPTINFSWQKAFPYVGETKFP